MGLLELCFRLPDWVSGSVGEGEVVFSSVDERMGLVVWVSRENVRRAVEVCTKAEIGRKARHVRPCSRANLRQSGFEGGIS